MHTQESIELGKDALKCFAKQYVGSSEEKVKKSISLKMPELTRKRKLTPRIMTQQPPRILQGNQFDSIIEDDSSSELIVFEPLKAASAEELNLSKDTDKSEQIQFKHGLEENIKVVFNVCLMFILRWIFHMSL